MRDMRALQKLGRNFLKNHSFAYQQHFYRALILGLYMTIAQGLHAQQIYIAHSNISESGFVSSGSISEYNAMTGAVINSSLVTGLNAYPGGIAISGSNLYVVNGNNVSAYTTTGTTVNTSFIQLVHPNSLAFSGGYVYVCSAGDYTVGKYTTSGTIINDSFVTSIEPVAAAISGNSLYVASGTGGTIGLYDATTGAAINASLVTGLNAGVTCMAISGNNLYIANRYDGTISKINATTGGIINATLITGLNTPSDLSILGNDLYVASSQTVGLYDATSGSAINASLITGLSNRSLYIATAVPEPSIYALLTLGTISLAFLGRKRLSKV